MVTESENYSEVVPYPVSPVSRWAGMGHLTVTTTWRLAIDAWATWLMAANRPATTLYLRTYHLRKLAHEHQHLTPWQVTLDDLLVWLASHDTWATETRRAYRASVRSFYAWAQAAGHVELSPAGLLPRIGVKRGRPRPAPEQALAEGLAGATDRERLMLMLGAFGGLRRGEISRVHSRDLVRDDDGWTLRVVGKGGHTRVVPLTPTLAKLLAEQPPGWAFPGQIEGHLSPEYVGKLMSRRLPEGWTAHTLRHRFATRMRAAGAQLDVIQELLGHASQDTTRIYTAIPHSDARAAVMLAA